MVVIHWAFYVTLAVGIVAVGVGVLVAMFSWVSPRIQRMAQGKSLYGGSFPCCPPGLGHNDPSENDSMRNCRRERAMLWAADEDPPALRELELSWGKFNATPNRKSKQKREALVEYSIIRDRIILNHMMQQMQGKDGPKELPAGFTGVETEDDVAVPRKGKFTGRYKH